MPIASKPAPAQPARNLPAALRLCWELVDIPTRDELLVATSSALVRAFDADVAFWDECAIHDQAWSVVDVECAQESKAGVAQALTEAGRDHPGVASYLINPHDLSPRRASDAIARVRHQHPGPVAPHELLSAEHQLSMLTALTPASGRCWVLLRTGRDFTCEQVTTAESVLPLLTALDRLHPSPYSAQSRGASSAPLTTRETAVLRQVATGATASAIGHRLGISPATVRKHLERVYAKLDCHDRLLAVEKGRALGLVARSGVTPEQA